MGFGSNHFASIPHRYSLCLHANGLMTNLLPSTGSSGRLGEKQKLGGAMYGTKTCVIHLQSLQYFMAQSLLKTE
jgi:hypothetical protein